MVTSVSASLSIIFHLSFGLVNIIVNNFFIIHKNVKFKKTFKNQIIYDIIIMYCYFSERKYAVEKIY